MKVTVDSRVPTDVAADLLAVPIGTAKRGKPRLSPRFAVIDRATRGAISAALGSGDFSGKSGESLLLYPSGGRSRAKRVLLIGLGDEAKIDADALRRIAGRAIGEGTQRRANRVSIAVPSSPADAAARRGETLAECQNEARQLSDTPANDLPPAELARQARAMAREVGLRARVLDVPALVREKMGGILAVGGGSANPPRLIVLEHRLPQKKTGAKGKKTARASGPGPFCMVGKGITFDSGGISIKPSAGMDEMKHDMSGAAAVFGAMRACALLDLPHPVVGVIGAAENMPSATAYRPGDVVRAMSGKTIEVLNTDAEGRVVLADALHYARTHYEPSAMVDLATLTGACMVALGRWATGAFTNHENLAERLRAAGDRAAERIWPMPLLDGHKEAIRSQIADIKNTGGRQAGASTAAAFLSHFVGKTPWVHLDIAGTGWTSAPHAYQRKGATGVGVRTLLELLSEWDATTLDD
jgi:leucyl aminopeptidase